IDGLAYVKSGDDELLQGKAHQKCPMVDLKDDIISCACHGSQFSVLDGSVKKGPAVQPLEAKQISVKGDSITLA
ncbi:Rieske (2Fe-2S) protein, partial [Streptomyces sp. NPDC006265]|uniref:Rieske (2Fe-2S) protein n=1 Tax=Streptomyces sp. NPDC006265 TaxID=3156740 RepID=UPI0033ACD3CF